MEGKDKSKAEKLYYDGSGDIRSFVEKIDLVATLKEHDGEKKAMFIGSKLGGSAFDVFRSLSADDKKNPDKIKEELLKEYSREERNREEALHSLMNCARSPGESPQRLAYKILHLVGLAYGSLQDATKNTIAKDFFVKALSKELQVALKSVANYSTMNLNQLSDETTRLEIAGVNNGVTNSKINAVTSDNEVDIVERISENVMEKLKSLQVGESREEDVQTVDNYRSRFRGRGYTRNPGRYQRGRGRGNQTQRNNGRRCRVCQSEEHMFRTCPVRFCQACGGKGHDAWNASCPNYS